MKKLTGIKLLYILSAAALLGLFTFLFAEIAEELKENELEAFDHAIINFVQSFINDQLTALMFLVTYLGSVKFLVFMAAAGGLILMVYKKWALSVFLLAGAGGGALFNWLLKWIFKRERPDILPLLTESGFSFPSGHSMGSFIFYGASAYILVHLFSRLSLKVLSVLANVLIIFLIGLSRIYLGVHYPSDVAGGFLAGGAWLAACIIIFRLYEFRKDL
ncbi:phosphatase PAP2 family protein [Bacillus infantis]|uniref:phosphatase PAP2 family protein n=1 Tax=Bacillus infantis TaxID=324767 RepID=UPI0020A006D8|nr:phosphatase PAP2 family protein [Bacillus infantis]MCP1159147.1 phosphatase PAP2 family protein [Bacillus infantis]MCR6611567.1 phosphatase PAP2 family protein [Bacillus infantis]